MILKGKLVDWYLGLTGALGQMLFPFILVSSKSRKPQQTIMHEKIHFQQALELGVIPFYIWIVIEYIKFGLKKGPAETECYENEANPGYLKTRKRWGWIKKKK